MKKDKYPLTAGGMLSGVPGSVGDPTRAGSQSAAAVAAARDMYSSAMNGYMPNGYHAYDPNMYAAGQYGNSSIYGAPRYDSMYGSSSGVPTSTTATGQQASYAYSAMSMYGNNSPYAHQGQSMSPAGGDGGGHQTQGGQNSPGGSVKSESGNGGGSGVSMPSESPSDNGYTIKRECTPPTSTTPGPPSQQQGGAQPQDLNRMISMYLPGDAAAAAAGDPNAQSRLYAAAGHYHAAMAAGATPASAAAAATDHLGQHQAPTMAHM
jgi:hypothetical protein